MSKIFGAKSLCISALLLKISVTLAEENKSCLDLYRSLVTGSTYTKLSPELKGAEYGKSIEFLERMGVAFKISEENKKLNVIEIVADSSKSPLNRYIYNLNRAFGIETRYFFRQGSSTIGGYSAKSDSILLSKRALSEFMEEMPDDPTAGVLRHEALHALSHRIKIGMKPADWGSHLGGHAVDEVALAKVGKTYRSDVDAAEVEATLMTGEALISNTLELLRKKEGDYFNQIRLLGNTKFQTIDALKIMGEAQFEVKLRSLQAIPRNSTVPLLRSSEHPALTHQLYSTEYMSEFRKIAAALPEAGTLPRLLLLQHSERGIAEVILLESGGYYRATAPKNLTGEKAYAWFEQHLQTKLKRINVGREVLIETKDTLLDLVATPPHRRHKSDVTRWEFQLREQLGRLRALRKEATDAYLKRGSD